jgi:uncharacterized membrane protein
MIQRIQSVWLFVASVLAFLMLKLSFYTGTHLPDNQYDQLTATDTMVLMITTIGLGILTLITIFLYKTRKIQLRLTIVALILEFLLLFLFYKETENFSQGAFSITAGLHLLIIIGLFLAARGIRKDEKLIRDSDRLR